MEFLEQLFLIKEILLTNIFPQFQYIASAIGAITATILIVTVILNSYVNNESIDWGMALRPFCIAFVLSVFPILVIQPLDKVGISVNRWMSEFCDDSKDKVTQLKETIQKKINEQNAIDISEGDEPTWEDPNIDNLYDNIEFVNPYQNGKLQELLVDIVNWLVATLTDIAQVFISFLSTVYLTLLSLTGPITFALAIIPAFRGGISSWFARYIQIMLWIPLTQIFVYMMYNLQIILYDLALRNNTITMPLLSSIILGAVAVIGIFKIPTLAEWVVESTGGQAFNSAINKTGVAAGRAGIIAGAAIGKKAGASIASLSRFIKTKI